MTEDQFIYELFKYGDVEVFKMDDSSLTLFMTGKELTKGITTLTILGHANVYCPKSSKIHVMKNSDTWLLLILKF